MVLSDRDIEGHLLTGDLVIDNLVEENIQPASVDMRLSATFLRMATHRGPVIDPRKDLSDLYEETVVEPGGTFVLHPGEFVLGATIERVKIPDFMVARMEGKSSLGRLGLMVHITAGYFDPGFEGTATLELCNLAPMPIVLYPGMKIGQMSFLLTSSRVTRPYGSIEHKSKYMGQSKPTESRMYQEYLGAVRDERD